MNLLNIVSHAIALYASVIIFFTALIAGEEMLILYSVLSGQGILRFSQVFLFGSLGMLFADSVAFAIASSRFAHKIKKHAKKLKHYKIIVGFMHRVSHKNSFLFLLYSKFIYGFRIITIVKLVHDKMRYRKFIFYDMAAILIWAGIMLPLGWFAGRGFSMAFNIVNDIRKAAIIAVLILISWYLIELFIKRRIVRKIEINQKKGGHNK